MAGVGLVKGPKDAPYREVPAVKALRNPDVRAWLDYDPLAGVFTWKANIGKARRGSVAGTTQIKGYISIGVLGRNYLAHRLAWFFAFGEMPVGQIDHRDGDKTNNRIANLRVATNSQNQANKPRSRASTSGVKGVYWWKTGEKWKAQIVVNNRSIFLGYFTTKEDAAEAYQRAAVLHFGEFAHPSLPTIGYLP
jgi:hypothetical protein